MFPIELGPCSPPLATTEKPEIDEAVEFVEGKNITDLTANDTLKAWLPDGDSQIFSV